MKIARFTIGSILFIEAFLLMYSPEQKYSVHSFMDLIKGHFGDCECLSKLSFECIENIRLIMVTFVLTGALSLTFGCSVFVGLLAQLMWTVIQSSSYQSYGLKEILSILTQVLFVLILFLQTRNDWVNSEKQSNQQRNTQSQLRKITQKPENSLMSRKENPVIEREKASVQSELKENKPVQKSEDNSISKSKKKKTK